MEKQTKPKKNNKAYLKYTGMLGQLLFLMLFAVFAGKRIDAYLQLERPYITVLLIILFFIGFIVRLYYDLTKES